LGVGSKIGELVLKKIIFAKSKKRNPDQISQNLLRKDNGSKMAVLPMVMMIMMMMMMMTYNPDLSPKK
jgi:hypothetical protein